MPRSSTSNANGMCLNILVLLKTRRDHPDLTTDEATNELLDRAVRFFGDNLADESELRGHFYYSELVLDRAVNPKQKCVQDHALPVRDTIQLLKNLPPERLDPTPDNIERLLEQLIPLSLIVQITKDEDDALDMMGLKMCMPSGFYQPGSPLYGDVFARYKHVGYSVIRPGESRALRMRTTLYDFIRKGRLKEHKRKGKPYFVEVPCPNAPDLYR